MAVGFNRNKNEGSVLGGFELDLGFVTRARLTLGAFATGFLLALWARRMPAQAGVPVLLEGAMAPALP